MKGTLGAEDHITRISLGVYESDRERIGEHRVRETGRWERERERESERARAASGDRGGRGGSSDGSRGYDIIDSGAESGTGSRNKSEDGFRGRSESHSSDKIKGQSNERQ